jgi:hypothetical protein
MSIPIPTRFRWSRHTGRFTADHGPIHLLFERIDRMEIAGLPGELKELDYGEPDRRGLLEAGCDGRRDMEGHELDACRSHFVRALEVVAKVARAWFGIEGETD